MKQLKEITQMMTKFIKYDEYQRGETIVDAGLFIKREPSKKYPSNFHFLFKVNSELIAVPPAGILSVFYENGQMSEGRYYSIIYMGKEEIKKGKWAGKKAITLRLFEALEGDEKEIGEKMTAKNTNEEIEDEDDTFDFKF